VAALLGLGTAIDVEKLSQSDRAAARSESSIDWSAVVYHLFIVRRYG
jgi:hypothetical protein